jgi:hypothetical protein
VSNYEKELEDLYLEHGLDELQGIWIPTWAPSVSSRDVYFIVYRVFMYAYSPHTSIFIVGAIPWSQPTSWGRSRVVSVAYLWCRSSKEESR